MEICDECDEERSACECERCLTCDMTLTACREAGACEDWES